MACFLGSLLKNEFVWIVWLFRCGNYLCVYGVCDPSSIVPDITSKHELEDVSIFVEQFVRIEFDWVNCIAITQIGLCTEESSRDAFGLFERSTDSPTSFQLSMGFICVYPTYLSLYAWDHLSTDSIICIGICGNWK